MTSYGESAKRVPSVPYCHGGGRTRNGCVSARIADRDASLDDAIGLFRVVFDAIGLSGIAHEHDAVHGWIDDGWRTSRHAACSLGGARDCGFWPRRKVSTMRITPPQSGHGSRSVSGMISAVDASSCLAVSAPSNVRTLLILTLRCAEASRP